MNSRETVLNRATEMYALNVDLPINNELKGHMDYAFNILERKDAWISSPHQNENEWWLLAETSNGELLKVGNTNTLEFGMRINSNGPHCKQLVDTLFKIKRSSDCQAIYAKLANTPVKANL